MSWEVRLNKIKQTYDVHAVVGIIKRDGKVLVNQRPLGKPYSGYWEFPGGKIETNELSIDALKRELREELNIEVTEAASWFQHIHTYPDKTVLLDVWLVDTFLGEPCSQENQVLRWVSFIEITKLHLLEGNWPILNKIAQLL